MALDRISGGTMFGKQRLLRRAEEGARDAEGDEDREDRHRRFVPPPA